MSREFKNSGIEWIGEIPKEWMTCYTSSLFHEHKEKNIGLKNTNLLSLSYGKIKQKDINTNEGLLPQSFETYNVIRKGDIVFRLTDLQNDKRSLRTGLCKEDGIITSAYVTLRANAEVDSAYYHYLFHSYDECKVFYGLGDGVRQGMNWADVRKLSVLVPSLSEQHKIANYLDKVCGEVDEMIALQEQMIEELKAYKQSVITEAVTKGLNPNVPVKNSGIDWIGEIPEHWRFGRLKRISNKIGDGLHGTPQYVDNSCYYFINGNNLGRKQIEIYSDTNKVDKAEFDKYYIELDENTILISLNGTIGNISFYNGEMVILGKSAGYVRLKSQSNKHYYYYYLQALNVKEYFYLSLAGTTIGNLSLGTLRNTPITIPPLSEQQSIASYLDTKCADIDALIAIKQAKIEELKDYKKSVIYEYVTGKKEVV